MAAVAAHLHAMNYAFLGHARAFYAAPVLLALTVLAFARLPRTGRSWAWARQVAIHAPLAALWLSEATFDDAVPVAQLPPWARDPLLTALVGSGLVWWFGAWRQRSRLLFHYGSMSLGLFVLSVCSRDLAPTSVGVMPTGGPDLAALRELAAIGPVLCRRLSVDRGGGVPLTPRGAGGVGSASAGRGVGAVGLASASPPWCAGCLLERNRWCAPVPEVAKLAVVGVAGLWGGSARVVGRGRRGSALADARPGGRPDAAGRGGWLDLGAAGLLDRSRVAGDG